MLSAKSRDSHFRVERLLQGIAWGQDPLAAVALKLQGRNFQKLNKSQEEDKAWADLIEKFPNSKQTLSNQMKLHCSHQSLKVPLQDL